MSAPMTRAEWTALRDEAFSDPVAGAALKRAFDRTAERLFARIYFGDSTSPAANGLVELLPEHPEAKR